MQSFAFHFTDPPGGQIPALFSLISTNYLANGTAVGRPQGFSLIVNPGGTIRNVQATNLMLTGPGTSTPEPGTGLSVALGALAVASIARRKLRMG